MSGAAKRSRVSLDGTSSTKKLLSSNPIVLGAASWCGGDTPPPSLPLLASPCMPVPLWCSQATSKNRRLWNSEGSRAATPTAMVGAPLFPFALSAPYHTPPQDDAWHVSCVLFVPVTALNACPPYPSPLHAYPSDSRAVLTVAVQSQP